MLLGARAASAGLLGGVFALPAGLVLRLGLGFGDIPVDPEGREGFGDIPVDPEGREST